MPKKGFHRWTPKRTQSDRRTLRVHHKKHLHLKIRESAFLAPVLIPGQLFDVYGLDNATLDWLQSGVLVRHTRSYRCTSTSRTRFLFTGGFFFGNLVFSVSIRLEKGLNLELVCALAKVPKPHSKIAILSRLSLGRVGFVPGTIAPQGPSEKYLCVFCLLVFFRPPMTRLCQLHRCMCQLCATLALYLLLVNTCRTYLVPVAGLLQEAQRCTRKSSDLDFTLQKESGLLLLGRRRPRLVPVQARAQQGDARSKQQRVDSFFLSGYWW